MKHDKYLLSDEDIAEFQALYKKIFGEDISRKEAYKVGVNLINLMRVLCTQTNK